MRSFNQSWIAETKIIIWRYMFSTLVGGGNEYIHTDLKKIKHDLREGLTWIEHLGDIKGEGIFTGVRETVLLSLDN